MERHFLKSYVELLIKTCHRRGAHAMGGMAAQIPIRDDPQANEAAMARGARRQAARGARRPRRHLDRASGPGADRARGLRCGHARARTSSACCARTCTSRPRDLLRCPTGEITEAGLRSCIRVGVQYLEAWLRGNGCVPLYHLMEDAATAEICRAQLWQWLHHGARTSDGAPVTVAALRSRC